MTTQTDTQASALRSNPLMGFWRSVAGFFRSLFRNRAGTIGFLGLLFYFIVTFIGPYFVAFDAEVNLDEIAGPMGSRIQLMVREENAATYTSWESLAGKRVGVVRQTGGPSLVELDAAELEGILEDLILSNAPIPETIWSRITVTLKSTKSFRATISPDAGGEEARFLLGEGQVVDLSDVSDINIRLQVSVREVLHETLTDENLRQVLADPTMAQFILKLDCASCASLADLRLVLAEPMAPLAEYMAQHEDLLALEVVEFRWSSRREGSGIEASLRALDEGEIDAVLIFSKSVRDFVTIPEEQQDLAEALAALDPDDLADIRARHLTERFPEATAQISPEDLVQILPDELAQKVAFTDLVVSNSQIGPVHWLGTDTQGRDISTHIVHGGRELIATALLAGGLSTFIAIMFGSMAALVGGIVDQVLTAFANLILTIPRLPLLLVLASLITLDNWVLLALLIGVLGWPALMRAIRAQMLSLRERDYVEAAVALDLGTPHIILREVLPNMISYVVVHLIFAITASMYAQIALVFLGFASINNYTWGVMLFFGRSRGTLFNPDGASMALSPVIAIALFQVFMIMFARALEEIFDPRLRTTT